MEFEKIYNYDEMMSLLNELCSKYDILKLSYIGQSILSKSIPVITIGDRSAQKSVLYIAAHHAAESICTVALLNFLEEYAQSYYKDRQEFGINLKYLYLTRKIYIIPMLNPDGVEYQINGVSDTNPLKERVINYNGSDDFTFWNSNARGVDLNHNYNAYFNEYKIIERENCITAGKTRYSGEYPESEPEVASVCNFIRFVSDELQGILTLHTQGKEIYYKSNGVIPDKGDFVSKIVSRMTGYERSEAEGMASYGGLTDWFIKEYNKPSLTIECGYGKNPLPVKQLLPIYYDIRETLFTFPILF